MALSAGLYYKTGFCAATAQQACTNASYTWSSYGCLGSAANNVTPTPCLIGTADVCPTTTVSVPALNVLVDAQYADVIVQGALLAFAVGFGVGMVIRMIRKLG